MKTMMISAFAFLTLANVASAAVVNSASVDAARGLLLVNVTYGGGCAEHKFKLEVGACLESFPVRCGVTVTDLTKNDFCEALISQDLEFSLAEYGLTDSYYEGASLAITGSDGKSVNVKLPR